MNINDGGSLSCKNTQIMKELIILIPGNPSVPGIYEHFIQQVAKDMAQDKEVHYEILHHLGQCNQKIIIRKNISVHDVIDDHRESILKLVKEHAPDKVILIGHSLGSAITISLHHELSDIVMEFVVLCPFTGPSDNNLPYLKMFRNPVTRFGMKNLSHSILLNQKVSELFFRQWLGDNPFNQLIPKEIKKPYYIKNFFSLVSNYIEDFEELKVHEKMKNMNPDNSFFLFAPNDYWVPDHIKEHLPENSTHHFCENIKHDFCLVEEQYKTVSKIVTDHLLDKKILSRKII